LAERTDRVALATASFVQQQEKWADAGDPWLSLAGLSRKDALPRDRRLAFSLWSRRPSAESYDVGAL
jgi:hypothetical protein